VTEPEVPREYRIELTPLALEMLAEVNDQRHKQGLTNRIEKLKSEPEKQGKALGDILKGYRSVRAVSQRYRVIYKVDRDGVLVLVVGVGIRRQGNRNDIYALLERLLQPRSSKLPTLKARRALASIIFKQLRVSNSAVKFCYD